MFSVNYIFLMNITYIFAIITCLGFLVGVRTIWAVRASVVTCQISCPNRWSEEAAKYEAIINASIEGACIGVTGSPATKASDDALVSWVLSDLMPGTGCGAI